MGGKDANTGLSRSASRDVGASAGIHSSARSSTGNPFYRQFLPSLLSNISPNDAIPSLDELSALAKHLERIKAESSARLARLETRSSDPFKPIFFSAPNDLFSPPGLPSGPANLYSDSSRQASSAGSASPRFQSTRKRASAPLHPQLLPLPAPTSVDPPALLLQVGLCFQEQGQDQTGEGQRQRAGVVALLGCTITKQRSQQG